MAFIRAKKTKTGTAYYLVESYRDGEKVRQRVLLYLGTGEEFSTLEKAEVAWQKRLEKALKWKEEGTWWWVTDVENVNKQISKIEQRLEKIREYLAQQ